MELSESHKKMEQLITELEQKVNNLNMEINMKDQLLTSTQWIHPALNKIEQRLDAMEYDHHQSSQHLLKEIQAIHNSRMINRIFAVIKHSLKPKHNQT